jgi:hypothetical protein
VLRPSAFLSSSLRNDGGGAGSEAMRARGALPQPKPSAYPTERLAQRSCGLRPVSSRPFLRLDPSYRAHEFGDQLLHGFLAASVRDPLIALIFVEHDLSVQVLTLGHPLILPTKLICMMPANYAREFVLAQLQASVVAGGLRGEAVELNEILSARRGVEDSSFNVA